MTGTSSDVDAIRALSEHIARVGYRDLPPAAVGAAKIFLQDSIGVGIAGSAGPWADDLLACLAGWGAADDAGVFARNERFPAPSAALANAYQIHNSEFDCVHEGAVVHAMTAVVPAAAAHAERRGGVTGEELITALVIGVDVACHIGAASRASLRFFRPGTAGGFGATAAVSKLLGFDAATTMRAMGAVYGQMCGTMQAHSEGSGLLGLQVGFNARNAIAACDMAGRGVPSVQNVLEGPFGFYPLFEGEYDAAALVEPLGRTWRIAELSHKPFPSGRATHGIVDGLLDLRRRIGFTPEDVERVITTVPPLVRHLVGRPVVDCPDPGYARLCAAYVGARALMRGTVGLEDFRPPLLGDPATRALAQRFVMEVDGNPDPNALGPVRVAVVLRDGQRHETRIVRMYGSPANPMSRDAHLAKFRRNWVSGARRLDESAGEELIRLVDALEAVPDVRQLVRLTRATAP
ncbi:MAG TPA: MmgE/PrpD family protein [Candidatus Methylomirabilis sp.]|nr:MmgE/PrpD family protein [Candidatus Methylomirabilis sp.]